jgi:hypothetical protein
MAAPKGNQFASKARVMSAHLKKRIEERQLAPLLMDALLEKALSGDVQAIREVFDRVDGKAPQDINVGGQDGNPVESITRIELVPLSGNS